VINPALFNRLQSALARVGIEVLEVDPRRLEPMFEHAAQGGYPTLERYLLAEHPRLLLAARCTPA
jgi:hypothetical protein